MRTSIDLVKDGRDILVSDYLGSTRAPALVYSISSDIAVGTKTLDFLRDSANKLEIDNVPTYIFVDALVKDGWVFMGLKEGKYTSESSSSARLMKDSNSDNIHLVFSYILTLSGTPMYKFIGIKLDVASLIASGELEEYMFELRYLDTTHIPFKCVSRILSNPRILILDIYTEIATKISINTKEVFKALGAIA